jgi:hypothetical protein
LLLLLLQLPPVVLFDSVVLLPTHTVFVPLLAGNTAFTVTCVIA